MWCCCDRWREVSGPARSSGWRRRARAARRQRRRGRAPRRCRRRARGGWRRARPRMRSRSRSPVGGDPRGLLRGVEREPDDATPIRIETTAPASPKPSANGATSARMPISSSNAPWRGGRWWGEEQSLRQPWWGLVTPMCVRSRTELRGRSCRRMWRGPVAFPRGGDEDPTRHAARRARGLRLALARGRLRDRRGGAAGRRSAAAPRSPASSSPTTWSSPSRPRRAFVSRGGRKLANALDAIGLDVADRRALDVGASTGGFTDCLLQRGRRARRRARRRLRRAALAAAQRRARHRARAHQRPRARRRRAAVRARPRRRRRLVHLAREGPAGGARRDGATRFDALALVKPQFEVGRERVGKGGVVRDAGRPPRGARRRRRRGARARRGRARLRLLGPARAEGQPRDVRVARRGRAAPAPSTTSTPRRARSSREQRVATVFTHRRPAETHAALGEARRRRARGRAGRCASRPRRRSSTRSRAGEGSSSTRLSRATPTSASRSAATARSCTACAPTRAPACRSSASTSARSASSPRSSRTT